MATITMKQLLEAGTHFGHQTKRWNPKMKKYIFGARNGIYIIDLQKTVRKLKEACKVARDVTAEGGSILFVGTKKQAQEIINEEATRCQMFYVNQRWLGGMLTNFSTIRKSVNRLKEIERMKEDGTFESLTKKEGIQLEKERAKLEKYLLGIKDMDSLPRAVFIVDTKKERIALSEARKLSVPTIALVDTNCDPDEVSYVVPGNDDAIRSIRLITSMIADAVIEGRARYSAVVGSTVGMEETSQSLVEAAAEDEVETSQAPAETNA